MFVEMQQMDRFLSEQGDTLKENSHPFTGTLSRQDIVRILSTSIDCESTPACPADVNADGVVDVSDILSVVNSWGICSGNCENDIDGDGLVGVSDLLAIVNAWGVCN